MRNKSLVSVLIKDPLLILSIFFLISLSTFVLKAISPILFPSYFVYMGISILLFIIFSNINFNILSLFSTHFYIISLVLLVATLIIGQVTRGTIRWIPIGNFSFQPAEIVRPFLIVFFANILIKKTFEPKQLLQAIFFIFLPVVLILIQPSLSVAILTIVGFFGVVIAMDFNKKNIIFAISFLILILPFFWFILKPYQKSRILNFASPESDPLGAGYNSIQSMIAVGSGRLTGRNLGEGIQTQLHFLPEKQTDFIFASIAEELGFFGVFLVLVSTFVLLWRLTFYISNSTSPVARAYLSGFFLTLLAQVIVHTGMNMGLLPVTGLPFPLVSAGGSSLLATSVGLGIALSCFER
jgi:cell division protein FtsW (lipid II flippase)